MNEIRSVKKNSRFFHFTKKFISEKMCTFARNKF